MVLLLVTILLSLLSSNDDLRFFFGAGEEMSFSAAGRASIFAFKDVGRDAEKFLSWTFVNSSEKLIMLLFTSSLSHAASQSWSHS